jgi:hypothetical protein
MSTFQTGFDRATGLLKEIERDNTGAEVVSGSAQDKYVLGDHADRRHVVAAAPNRADLRQNVRYEATGLAWTGGGATKAFTVTGALLSAADGQPETAYAELVNPGATVRKVVSAVVSSNNTVTVTLDDDNTDNDVVLNLFVYKI